MELRLTKILDKINKLTTWQAAIIIAVIGFAVFFNGLTTPFMGDDLAQIVNNVPVHSITHIKIFFEGSTFYNGAGIAPLSGTYYRPLMSTVYSLLYTIFGPNPAAFHSFQLLLYIGCAVEVYILFRYSFNTALSLALALVFLVHPINSQIVYFIASLQEVLVLFFGLLALLLVMRFQSNRALIAVGLSLLMALLSKETGFLFVLLILLYIYWWDRKRFLLSLAAVVVPTLAWFLLRLHAIGLNDPSHLAPIDYASLADRLLTMPTIVLFYVSKFVFPYKLATAYFWHYHTFSLAHVLLPFLVDMVVVFLIFFAGHHIKLKTSRAHYLTFLFFSFWALIFLLAYSQLIPLDMTVCEAWFYVPMVGVLGMLGSVLTAFPLRLPTNSSMLIVVILVGLLGLRTGLRSIDYHSELALSFKDIAASREDFNAYTDIANSLINTGKFEQAKPYVLKSLHIFPTYPAYNNLGLILGYEGNYAGAALAYKDGLRFGNASLIYENYTGITPVYENTSDDQRLFLKALRLYPADPLIWSHLAIYDAKNGDSLDAKRAIAEASMYGEVSQTLYLDIMNSKPFQLQLPNHQLLSVP